MKPPITKLILDEQSKKIALFLFIMGCFINIVISYGYLNKENNELKNELEISQTAHSITQKKLSQKTNENVVLNDNLKTEKETNQNFQGQIEGIKGTVGILEKLSKTDSELLKKYSKVYFLNENYVPVKLTTIDPKYLFDKSKIAEAHGDVIPFLTKMLDDAKNQGIDISILSAYRSFNTQASLKSAYKITYGYGANKFSADQGYSEHQLGTTFDLTTQKTGSSLTGFEKTETFKWLENNAYKYGFIISYPKNNTYYIFEPWHWRFVGTFLAQKIHDQNTYFYALDQREIDQYLVSIFD